MLSFFRILYCLDGGDRVFNNIILWEFDILSSPRTQAIPPRDPDSQGDELDNVVTSASEN